MGACAGFRECDTLPGIMNQESCECKGCQAARVGNEIILDTHDDDIVESMEHHCVVLTPDRWMCEDCGASFPRDSELGDFPEECILEAEIVCVAYIPGD